MDSCISSLLTEYDHESHGMHSNPLPKVGLADVDATLDAVKQVLFPGVYAPLMDPDPAQHITQSVQKSHNALMHCVCNGPDTPSNPEHVVTTMINALPNIKRCLSTDITAIFEGDPAAKTITEVIMAYPSLEAITVYRLAHALLELGCPIVARMMASLAHRRTGIDIHPGARIGNHFCIDHGTGVVIGETAIIGHHVKLYQGVTIGALSVLKEQANQKRHPTIEDYVTIYARTTSLGGDTIIGHHSIIGGNVWLTESLPPHSKRYTKGV